MAKKSTYYYYKIYDDQEQFNYIKSTLQEKRIRLMLKRYEKTHDQYLNAEFVKFLKHEDPRVELIEVAPISY